VLFKIEYCPFKKPNTDWSFAKDDGTNLGKIDTYCWWTLRFSGTFTAIQRKKYGKLVY